MLLLPLCYNILLIILLFGDVSCRQQVDIYNSTNIGNKIVGGGYVNIEDFPYQAHLYVYSNMGRSACGGSIISNRYILTAAHCMAGAKRVRVRIGSEKANSGGVTFISENFKTHSNFNPNTLDNDVAVIRSPYPIIFGDKIKPIALPSGRARVLSGVETTVSGWGATGENEHLSNDLMAVTVLTLSHEVCRKSYETITQNMICAGVPVGGRDACQGDSGGPAVAKNVQIGIVSFGTGCARPRYPGVYTSLSSPSIREWIRNNAGV